MLQEIWHRATTAQPPLEQHWALTVAVAALILTWTPQLYLVFRHVATLLHEAGHAFIALLVGRKLRGIKLHSDTSGVTLSRGRPTGPGMIATLLAGYPAPAILGLLGAFFLQAGYASATLWVFVLICALMLLLIRNFYGLLVVLTLGSGIGWLSWSAPAFAITISAHFAVWALLLIAPRTVVDLQRNRRRRPTGTSDADQLGKLTRTPPGLWVGVFWLVTVLCLVTGGFLILP